MKVYLVNATFLEPVEYAEPTVLENLIPAETTEEAAAKFVANIVTIGFKFISLNSVKEYTK